MSQWLAGNGIERMAHFEQDSQPLHKAVKSISISILSPDEHNAAADNVEVYYANGSPIHIGRASCSPSHRTPPGAAASHFGIHCPVMSRAHAIIEIEGSNVFITDQGSHHGTWRPVFGLQKRLNQHERFSVVQGDIFIFGRRVEKAGKTYEPASVAINVVYDDFQSNSDSQSLSNRYGLYAEDEEGQISSESSDRSSSEVEPSSPTNAHDTAEIDVAHSPIDECILEYDGPTLAPKLSREVLDDWHLREQAMAINALDVHMPERRPYLSALSDGGDQDTESPDTQEELSDQEVNVDDVEIVMDSEAPEFPTPSLHTNPDPFPTGSNASFLERSESGWLSPPLRPAEPTPPSPSPSHSFRSRAMISPLLPLSQTHAPPNLAPFMFTGSGEAGSVANEPYRAPRPYLDHVILPHPVQQGVSTSPKRSWASPIHSLGMDASRVATEANSVPIGGYGHVKEWLSGQEPDESEDSSVVLKNDIAKLKTFKQKAKMRILKHERTTGERFDKVGSSLDGIEQRLEALSNNLEERETRLTNQSNAKADDLLERIAAMHEEAESKVKTHDTAEASSEDVRALVAELTGLGKLVTTELENLRRAREEDEQRISIQRDQRKRRMDSEDGALSTVALPTSQLTAEPRPVKRARLATTQRVLAGVVAGSILTWAGLAFS